MEDKKEEIKYFLMISIGIDLGTTYSCVSVWQKDRVEIIPNDQGNRTTPSYVAFNDSIVVGENAKIQATLNPTNTIFDVKRLIGRKFSDSIVQSNIKYWPFKVVQKQGDKPYIQSTVTDAVITVPAYFNDAQRQATKDAAVIAKLNVQCIINEPTAAIIAYGLEKKNKLVIEKTILIFNLGGCTFDVSILSVKDGGVFEIKASAGDLHLGGVDFDNRMVSYFIKEFKDKYKKELTTNHRAINRLRSSCERAKRTLSSSTQASIEIVSIMGVAKALSDAKLDKQSIHEIILVGGSTRIPKIQSLLQHLFCGIPIYKSIDPDQVIAYGATIQATIINNNNNNNN
ncbi:Hsc70-4 [Cavenderia fasciculata]|uniref:Hsc70-4 n=1 Tax=Cavenderia fasciculata TaxID=261658 RepID=F4PLX0_CACFS|nr:Hsc70-4 [Cavenderia fasciculata]EGG23524.1 Hsc70-4 [Cavenderia fasciculata]|eukprot:XP_004361375.1 Hsc70-4 [Cavenderia fasciculata]